MSIARDRVVGILFGNLVVAIVFTLIWPVSLTRRIDPAIAAFLRRLAAMAAAGSRAKRWALAAETQAALGVIDQDLVLIRYEPRATRPDETWLDRRREIAHALASLQGPLLLASDQDPALTSDIARRLNRLAEDLGPHSGPAASTSETPSATLASDSRVEPDVGASLTNLFVDTPLTNLERLVAQPEDNDEEGSAIHARA